MVQTRTTEILVGGFMTAGFVALFFLAMQVSDLNSLTEGEGYQVTARFDNIGGLKVRSPVSMAGVRVGRVTDISFDNTTYEAVVIMLIDRHRDTIPDDTFAKIYTAGLLGINQVHINVSGIFNSI